MKNTCTCYLGWVLSGKSKGKDLGANVKILSLEKQMPS